MPLITCPDCGREVSDAAPACPHCGRPFHAPPAAPPAAPAAPLAPKPMAGIVVACVLGVLTLVWTYGRPPAASPAMDEVHGLSNAIHGLGSGLLLIGALMSLAGHRWGNTVVRATSFLRIALVSVLILVMKSTVDEQAMLTNQPTPEGIGWVLLVSLVVGLVPWLLYLYLFRKSKYP